MRFSKFFFLFIIILLGNASSVKAKPFWGGDISYEYIGQDSFYVTITQVEECSWQWPGGSFVQLNISNNCGNILGKWIYRASEKSVSPYCASNTNVPTCSGAIAGGFYEVTYEGLVVLTGTGCTDWTLSAELSYRPTSVVNIDVTGWGDNIMVYTKIHRNLSVNNSSPKSKIPSFMYAVQNQPSQLSVQAQDEDSLTYELSRPLRNNGFNVTYISGYSYTNPLGSNNLTIDQNTGLIEFTPDSVGDFVVGITIKEWDRVTGALKSFYVQEKYITVLSGTQHIPAFDNLGFSNLGDGALTNRVLETCPGDSVNLTIQVSDSNITDQLTLTHDIYEVLGSNAEVSVTGNNPVMVDIKWVAITEKVGDLTFQITASDNGCPIILKSYELFTIKNRNGVFAGVDQFLCLGDTVNLNASGGSSYVWSSLGSLTMDTVSSSSGYNATCTNCANTTVFPGSSAMYKVSSPSSSVCGNFDTVNVNMSPSFTINPPLDTIICLGSDVSLPVSASLINANTQFSWSPIEGLSNYQVSNPTAIPQQPTSYTVAVTNGNCTKIESIQVGLFPSLPKRVIIGDSLLCVGDTILLSNKRTGFSDASCGDYNNNPLDTALTGEIGVDTNITDGRFDRFCPYNRYYWGAKGQYLYTVNELLGMGLKPGADISSIAFDVVSLGLSNEIKNLEVSIGCTSRNELTNGWVNNLTLVVPQHDYTVVTGWNDHNFIQAYIWDGKSNIVIGICKNNLSWSIFAPKTRYSISSINRSAFVGGDYLGVCNVDANFNSQAVLPNVKFKFKNPILDSSAYTFTWPTNTNISSVTGDSTLVYPTVNSTYTGVLTHSISGCTDTVTKNIAVKTSLFDARFTADSSFCVNDSAEVFIPNHPGGIFTGVGVDSAGVFDPSVAGAGNWPINYNIPAAISCTNDSTQTITVLGLPDASIVTTEICAGLGGVILDAVTPGGTWIGNEILNPTTGLFVRTGLVGGFSSNVIHTLTDPCTSSDTIDILITTPFQFTLVSDTIEICQEDSLDINSNLVFNPGPTQGQYPVYEYADTSGIVNDSGWVNSYGKAAGWYELMVSITDSLGNCGETKSIMVKVNASEASEWISPPNYCSAQTQATLLLTPGIYSAAISFSQLPLAPLTAQDTLLLTAVGLDAEFDPQLRGEGKWEFSMSYTNVSGCISTQIDTIIVAPSPSVTVQNTGLVLTASIGSGYSYQWLDCDDNMNPIVGATAPVYTPDRKGRFAVQVSVGNCEEVSACYETWPLSIDEFKSSDIEIYPNPTSDILNIDKGINASLEITVTNSAGAVVYQTNSHNQVTTINMAKMATGIYVVTLKNERGMMVERVVKR